MSPELIAPQQFGIENSHRTKFSDCYALGMVVYETITGHPPFHRHTDLTVLVRVSGGEHPPREPGFADDLWGMLELCWKPQPNARPSIEDVLQCLEMVTDLSWSTLLDMDGEMEMIDDDWDSTNGSFDVLMPADEDSYASSFFDQSQPSDDPVVTTTDVPTGFLNGLYLLGTGHPNLIITALSAVFVAVCSLPATHELVWKIFYFLFLSPYLTLATSCHYVPPVGRWFEAARDSDSQIQQYVD